MNRLQATMLYSAILARRGILVMVAVQVISTVILFLFNHEMLLAPDLLVVLVLMVFGILYYHRHTAFCVANAVSMRYRMVSFLAVMGGMALSAALLSCLAWAVLRASYGLFWCEFYRYMVSGRSYFSVYPMIVKASELLCYYFSVMMFGSLLGCMREKKGEGFTLLTLLIATGTVVVLAVAGRYMQALGLIAVLPVWLMQSPWSAMVLSLLVAVGCLWIMMRQVSVSVKKERSNSHEAA